MIAKLLAGLILFSLLITGAPRIAAADASITTNGDATVTATTAPKPKKSKKAKKQKKGKKAKKAKKQKKGKKSAATSTPVAHP